MIKENEDPVEFNGQCAFAVSLGKMGVKGSESHKLIQGGKVYYFSNPVAKIFWRLLPGSQKKAEHNWSK